MIFFRLLPLLLLLISCEQRTKFDPMSLAIEFEYPVTLIISGDYMQHYPQVQAAKTAAGFDYETSLQHIAPLWKSADFALINLETTLSNSGDYSGYPQFCSPVEIAQALKNCGITHFALANNHAMDKHRKGVENTIQELEKLKVGYTGVALDSVKAYQITYLEKYNKKIAILNHTYDTNGIPVPKGIYANASLDTLKIAQEIKQAKLEKADYIVAFMHWGYEYHTSPNKEQKQLAKWLRHNGVDVVVGSHPHVAQPIDHKNSIVYSLGNFVSNQRKPLTDVGYSVIIKFHSSLKSPKITPVAHYVDVSEIGVNKYRVLPLEDSLVISNIDQRKRMINAIKEVNKIIGTEVK